MERIRPRKLLKLNIVPVLVGFVLSSQSFGQSKLAMLHLQDSASEFPALLKLSVNNANKQRYSGVRVVEYRQNGNSKRYEEWVSRSGRKSRVEFPSSSEFAGQVIVEDRGERRHYFPDKNEVHISPARREDALDRLAGMARRAGKTKFTEQPGETIAGLKSILISLVDERGSIMQKMFIEPKTGIVLRRELFDRTGAPTGSFSFSKINLSPQFDDRIFILDPKGARTITPTDRIVEVARKDGYIAAALSGASGLKLDAVRTSTLSGEDVLMEIYAAGRERITLFQFKHVVNVDSMKLKRTSSGEFGTHSWTYRGHTFVLVGGPNAGALSKIAESLTVISKSGKD